ncbi:MAG TPA: hypothetical protein VEZ47_10630 [Gemmatirosa sp.]|nr:hypothetical protein [Gemmatirosa sp.]
MPCFAVVLALATPRILVAILWLLTSWFVGLFATILWPILGFLFAPTTLLWYSVVQRWFGGQWSLWPIAGLVVALFLDGVPARLGIGRRR